MKQYELAYLINPILSEDEARSLQEQIASNIKDGGGVLDGVISPVRKRLAYPIKKQVQAFFGSMTFHFNPESLPALDKKIKEDNQIIRHLIVFKPPVKAIKIRRRIRKEGEEFVSAAPTARPERKKKVELKEIEKKLEEILE